MDNGYKDHLSAKNTDTERPSGRFVVSTPNFTHNAAEPAAGPATPRRGSVDNATARPLALTL